MLICTLPTDPFLPPSLPPGCLAWHQFPLTQTVMGEREIQRGRTAADDTISLYHVNPSRSRNPCISIHKSHRTCSLPLSAIHPPIPPFYFPPGVSSFITPCLLRLSISAPADSHPSTRLTYSSICLWTRVLPWIMTFYAPINFWNLTSQSSTFFPPSAHLSLSFASSHQDEDASLSVHHLHLFPVEFLQDVKNKQTTFRVPARSSRIATLSQDQ